MAKSADAAALRYDIDVLFIAPYVDIANCGKIVKTLVFAPYGCSRRRSIADVLPEAISAAGVKVVVLTSANAPCKAFPLWKEAIERANGLSLLIRLRRFHRGTKAVSQLHPDIISPGPSELIKDKAIPVQWSMLFSSIKAVKDIYPDILVEQAAGIPLRSEYTPILWPDADRSGGFSGINGRRRSSIWRRK